MKISSTATTEAVAASSRTLAPSKTWARSAWIAAGPVTWARRPEGTSDRRALRRSVTTGWISAAPASPTTTVATTAVRSSLVSIPAGPPSGPETSGTVRPSSTARTSRT